MAASKDRRRAAARKRASVRAQERTRRTLSTPGKVTESGVGGYAAAKAAQAAGKAMAKAASKSKPKASSGAKAKPKRKPNNELLRVSDKPYPPGRKTSPPRKAAKPLTEAQKREREKGKIMLRPSDKPYPPRRPRKPAK